MASGVRLNKVIDLLERDQVVFSSGTIMSDNLDDIMFVADSDYDFAIIEMEHQGFDFTYLRTALQYFLNRKRLVEQDTLQPDVVPFVRIPPNAREAGGINGSSSRPWIPGSTASYSHTSTPSKTCRPQS